MKHETLEKVQKIELRLLDTFISVCNEHSLSWFADGGTLLGAVRKGAMIPWDDDIDVCMPRQDYDQLLDLAYKKKIFNSNEMFFQTPATDGSYFNVHARLRMNGTSCISSRELNIASNKGIFIDIYPIDAVPDDPDEANAEIGMLRAIGKYSGAEQSLSKINTKYAFITMNEVMSSITNKNFDSKYVAISVFYRYSTYQYAKFLRSTFSCYKEVAFVGLSHQLRIPAHFSRVLECWYGLTWTIEKHEASFHECFYDPDKDYSEYDKMRMTEEDFNQLLKKQNEEQ